MIFFSPVYGVRENRQIPYKNGSTCLKKRQYPKYRVIPSNSQLNLFPVFSFLYTGDALLKAVHLKFCLLQYERQNWTSQTGDNSLYIGTNWNENTRWCQDEARSLSSSGEANSYNQCLLSAWHVFTVTCCHLCEVMGALRTHLFHLVYHYCPSHTQGSRKIFERQ